METIRPLLVAGNSKLSEAIQQWGIPAGKTCPGKSKICFSKCYARHKRYQFPQVQDRLTWCYEMSKRRDFAKLLISEIRRKGAAFVVRIHSSGDYYSAAYVRKWIEVIRACPFTKFYSYTRSYRKPSIYPALVELAELPNHRLWFSADNETGEPVDLPPNVSVAWMQVQEDEVIPNVDLVFRDYPLRENRSNRIGLSVICPVDTPTGREHGINCGVCRFCWK